MADIGSSDGAAPSISVPAHFEFPSVLWYQWVGVVRATSYLHFKPAHLECEVIVRLRNPVKLIPVLIIASTLSACATEDLASELSQPNYGRRQLNSDENVDSRLLMNGLYAPKPFGVSPYAVTPYAPACLTAEYRCSQQARSAWSSFDP